MVEGQQRALPFPVAVTAQGGVVIATTDDALAISNDGGPLQPFVRLPARSASLRVGLGLDSATITLCLARPDGQVAFWSSAYPGDASMFDARRIRLAAQAHPAAATLVAVSADGSRAATADPSGDVIVWNPADASVVSILAARDAQDQSLVAGGLALSPDGSTLAVAWTDGSIWLYDAADGAALSTGAATRGAVRALAFSADGLRLAAGLDDGSLLTWRRQVDEITRPLAVPAPGVTVETAAPAEGVLLTHEQSWVTQGIAQGELLHSLCLAPGEITQIAVSSHARSVAQSSADLSSAADDLSQTGMSSGNETDSERTSAAESSSGSTTSAATGTSGEGGVGGSLLGGLGISGGAATSASTGVQTSVSTGTRQVADEANQDVHQSATEAARLARSQYTAAVREVSETDSLELSTRVVANYNHMHALTIQYYEVIQVQRLRTRVVDAHRLLFVPMRVVDFADAPSCAAALTRFGPQIVESLRALGLRAVATCADLVGLSSQNSDALRASRIEQLWASTTDADTLLQSAAQQAATASAAADAASMATLTARDALREETGPGLARRAALQRVLQAAVAAQQSAQADLVAAQARVDDLSRAAATARRRKQDVEALLAETAITARDTSVVPVLDKVAMDRLEARLVQALVDHQLAVNQGIWMRLEPATFAGLLAGHAYQGEDLSATLDPTPVAVYGAHVAFRWNHSDPEAAQQFRLAHVFGSSTYEDTLPMPTGGVFGEAVLGQSNSAEKIDITRFWNWSDALPPLRPTEIDALAQPQDEALPTVTAPAVPAVATTLSPLTFPTLGSNIGSVTSALGSPELFRDLSGAKASAALAQSATELAAQGASTAATLAGKNFQRQLQFQQKLADTALDLANRSSASVDPTMAGAVLNAGGGTPSGDPPGASTPEAAAGDASTPTAGGPPGPSGGSPGAGGAPGAAGAGPGVAGAGGAGAGGAGAGGAASAAPASSVEHVGFAEEQP